MFNHPNANAVYVDFAPPFTCYAEFINLKCFTCAPLRRYEVSISFVKMHDKKVFFKKKGFVMIQYTHDALIVNGLKKIYHVNRMFLFRLKINHADFFSSSDSFALLFSNHLSLALNTNIYKKNKNHCFCNWNWSL